MEHNKVIETLDSLWFYGNVCSSSINRPLSIVSDDYGTAKLDLSKAITPILRVQKTQLPVEAIIVEEFPKGRDFVLERNRVSRETWEEEKKERRIGKKRRSKGESAQRRVVNRLDFGFDLNEIDELCTTMMMDGKSNACDLNGMMSMNMPSFSDEMAMREHLKLWAHSVACAVK